MERERFLSKEERIVEDIGAGPSQPRVDSLMNKSSHDAHRQLLRTAYELAMTPTMPLCHLSVLVKCLQNAGVQVIKGTRF